MLLDRTEELNFFLNKSKFYLTPWLQCLGGIWIVNIINWTLLQGKLNILGIYPRHLLGLIGIPLCPILHQNFNHLFFNSIPLFVLGLALLAQDLPLFYQVTFLIIIASGALVWLFGRHAIHIGASGLITGYFGFFLAIAYFNPNIISILLALLVLYYFGSIFLGIFPKEDKVSWESHLFGFLSGIFAAGISMQNTFPFSKYFLHQY